MREAICRCLALLIPIVLGASESWEELMDRANRMADEGRYQEAQSESVKALSLAEQMAPEDGRRAATLNNLGVLARTAGRYAESEAYYLRALNWWRTQYPGGTLHTAPVMANLGELYSLTARYGEARVWFERALEIYTSHGGADARMLATLVNLASLNTLVGQYEASQNVLDRAVSLARQFLPSGDPRHVSVWNVQANLHYATGKFDQAISVLKRSRGLLEGRVEARPQLALVLYQMSTAYQRLRRFGEAAQSGRGALEIWESTLGPDHAKVAAGLSSLAEVYSAEGIHGEAEQLLRRSIGITGRRLGSSHPDHATLIHNLAMNLVAQRRLREAEPLYRVSLQVLEKTLGAHSKTATVLENLGLLLLHEKRYAEAEEALARCLEIRRSAQPERKSSPALFAYAKLLRRSGRGDIAKQLENEAKPDPSTGPGFSVDASILARRSR